MRLLCVCAGLAALLMVNPTPVLSQRMLEHAITAAGGSASGAAGKKVSEGIDKIFGKLKSQSDNAATKARLLKRLKPQEATEQAVAPAVMPPVEGAFQAQPTPPLAGSRAATPRQATGSSSVGWNTPIYRDPQPRASLDDLQSVEAGTSRRDLVARLGTPSSRVMIPEHGELREVYHFSSGQVHLGKVTLSNGSVANVEVDPRAR